MKKNIVVAFVCLFGLFALPGYVNAQLSGGGMIRYQSVADGDAGYGVEGLVEWAFQKGNSPLAQVRVGYLTGFGDNGFDLSAVPFEVGIGYRMSLSEKVDLYSVMMLGYNFMNLDASDEESGITINGVWHGSGSRISYSMDDAVGYGLAFGGNMAVGKRLSFFGELRYQILEPELKIARAGGNQPVRVGNITFMSAPSRSWKEKVDLSGLGVSLGVKMSF